MAFTALLMAFYRQSKRRTAEFLRTLLGQPCSAALAVKMQNQARLFTVFAVRATREATALTTFLGEKFRGIVTCDRAKMYWHWGCLQWCWAHLKRDFQAMIDGGDSRAKHLGWRLRRATCELFEHWADYHAGRISRAALVRRMGPVRRKVECLLLRGTQSGSRFVETMLTVIETCRQQGRNVFSFLTAAVEAHLAHQPAPSLLCRV
jgi:hypothetical protein